MGKIENKIVVFTGAMTPFFIDSIRSYCKFCYEFWLFARVPKKRHLYRYAWYSATL